MKDLRGCEYEVGQIAIPGMNCGCILLVTAIHPVVRGRLISVCSRQARYQDGKEFDVILDGWVIQENQEVP